MGDSLAILRNRIRSAEDLRSVVKTMKAMSAANITQFEQALTALDDYSTGVELALSLCLRRSQPAFPESPPATTRSRRRGLVILGSDQGMVGQFNEHVVEAVRDQIDGAPAAPKLWVVGERVQARLETAGHRIDRSFPTPQSIEAIAPLVSELLFEIEADYIGAGVGEVIVHHNAPMTRSNYKTACVRLLPLDQSWRTNLMAVPWPESRLPEMIDCSETSRTSLISEFLFVSLYQACTASCSAENAARLAAMQRAEKNIDDRRSALDRDYNHQRQSMIDEELFELICGFEALSRPAR